MLCYLTPTPIAQVLLVYYLSRLSSVDHQGPPAPGQRYQPLRLIQMLLTISMVLSDDISMEG